MKMRYPLLHKANGILLGMCFFIFDTPIVEGRWVYSEMTTRGVLDVGTLQEVDVSLGKHGSHSVSRRTKYDKQ
jgi:hypothetical protein